MTWRTDEVLLQSLQLLVLTNNLFVESFASNSRHAPEVDEKRFLTRLGLGDSLGVIIVNPVSGNRGVFEHPLRLGLSAQAAA